MAGRKKSGSKAQASRMFVKRTPRATETRDRMGERITEDLADGSDLIKLQNARPKRGGRRQQQQDSDAEEGHFLSEDDELDGADLLDLPGGDMEDDDGIGDDDDDDQDEDPNNDTEAKYMSRFGSHRKDHYGGDNVDYFDLDEEDADAEEEEARRIQQEQLEDMDEDDFQLDAGKSKNQKKKEKKQRKQAQQVAASEQDPETLKRKLKDAQLLKKVSAELRAVDLDLQEDSVVVDQISRDFSGLSETERLQLLRRDSPMLIKLLEEFRQKLAEVKQISEPLARLVRDQPTARGVSLLQTKVQLMLAYLTNISFFLLLKAEGKSVEEHPVVNQLVRIRVMLEKIRPLDKKISYQLEKLLQQAAASESAGAAVSGSQKDPLSYRPNPSALVTEGGALVSGGDVGEVSAAEDKLYRAPRMPTTGAGLLQSDKELERAKALQERRRRQALRSGLVDQMRAQLDVDAPEAVPSLTDDGGSRRDMHEADERRRFEEDNFLRLMETRKDRKRDARMSRLKVTGFEDLDDFSGLADLAEDEIRGGGGSQKMDLDGLEGSDEEFDGLSNSQYSEALQNYDRADRQNKKRKRQQDQERSSRKSKNEVHYSEKHWDDIEEGERRGASKEIIKNRGLTKSRPKDQSNPRIRHRKAFDKALKRRASQVREFSGANPAYSGEKTGIKTNLVKAVKLKQ